MASPTPLAFAPPLGHTAGKTVPPGIPGGKTLPANALRDWFPQSASILESGLSRKSSVDDDALRRPSVDSLGSVEDPADAEASKVFNSLTEEQKMAMINDTYEELLFSATLDVAFDAHRERIDQAGLDIFGTPIGDKSMLQDRFLCFKCNVMFPAQRYAPHLEKCLGFGGRSNSRSSSRRPGMDRAAGSPLGADSDAESSSLGSRKRKESPLRKAVMKKMKSTPASPPIFESELIPSFGLKQLPSQPLLPILLDDDALQASAFYPPEELAALDMDLEMNAQDEDAEGEAETLDDLDDDQDWQESPE
ncbi:Ataxin-7-like protein 3 [Geranomyces michiganensis]|nr:Ataxin-7-like protein 3 [Geranomyces michiganensis]